MRQGTSRDSAKDEVLRPILAERQAANDECWNSILLAIFFPGLEAIWRKKGHWAKGTENLWPLVTWSFLEAVGKVDVRHRPSRLVQKLINDTYHYLHDSCSAEWDRGEHEIAVDPFKFEELAGVADDPMLNATDEAASEAAAIGRLRRHLDAGRLCEPDFFLLCGTCIYGRSLAECARELELTPEAAKKRRQRALAAIRPYEIRE
jgi:hypothetical protein